MSAAQSLPGKPISLWLDTTPTTAFPSLKGKIAVDVAIIGGGIVGITAATILKEAGLRVALLEANRIAESVTGNTTAKITSLHGLVYDHLLRQFGEEKAGAYAEANQAAIEWIAKRVSAQAIDCDFKRTEAYTYTTVGEDVKRIERETKAALRLGLPATFTTETTLPFPVKAAIRFDRQASFHPRKYLLALAASITTSGCDIYEHSRVIDIREAEGESASHQVITAQGEVEAPHVIVATHFPIYDKAFYFARLSQHRSLVLAMRLNEGLPTGMFISTEPFLSLRTHPFDGEELLFVGGEGFKAGQGEDTVARYQRLEQAARDYFSVKSIEYRWATQDNWTIDQVPYIGRATPNARGLYVATGFAGWGMSNGTVAALLLTDLIRGRENPWTEVYDPNRFKVESSSRLVKENANVVAHFVGDRFGARDADEVMPGQGAIVKTDQGKMALYRAEDGTAISLSPICTHMGCIVSWNAAEKSWDCPCHGSRFAVDGKVIQGPAMRDLERK